MALDWNGLNWFKNSDNTQLQYFKGVDGDFSSTDTYETWTFLGGSELYNFDNKLRKNKIDVKKADVTGIVGGGFSVSYNKVTVNGKTKSYFEVAMGVGADIGVGVTTSKINIESTQNLTPDDYINKQESNNLNVGLRGAFSSADYNIKGHTGTEIAAGGSGAKLGISTQKTILQFSPQDALNFVKDNVNMVFRRIFYETNYYPYLKR